MDPTEKITNINDSYLEQILQVHFYDRIDRGEIDFINRKIGEMNPEEISEIREIMEGFYHDRDYCYSRGISYSSLKELSNPLTRQEVIADAYRLYSSRTKDYFK